MKTILLNGSPHRNGDTAYLVEQLCRLLPGEVREVRAYDLAVSPCVDCRHCWQKPGCCIEDAMQPLYAELFEADCILIASPVYFAELTPPLLAIASRLQFLYTNRRFLGIRHITAQKAGGVLLCGGGQGGCDSAEHTARMVLRLLNATCCGSVHSLATDTLPAREDAAVLPQLQALAGALSVHLAGSPAGRI